MKKRMLAILLCIGIILSMTAMTVEETAVETEVSEVQGISDEASGAVDSVESTDIEVHLFDYGYRINSASEKVLGFSMNQSELDYKQGNNTGTARVYPVLGDAVDGYPVITGWLGTSATNDGTGSLKYLFDKSKDYISGGGDTSYSLTSNNYQFKHFEIDHVQVFQKQGDKYVFDSAKNAAFLEVINGETYLKAYDYALRPFACSSAGEANLQGHFLPFNKDSQKVQLIDTDGTLLSSNVSSNMTGVDGDVSGFPLSKKTNNLYAISEATATNQAFGMSVEFYFNMPKDGKVNGEDMVFDFMGDDDVFVYIDGKPVLNIGGGHAATKGTINFATGEVTVYEEKSASEKVTDGRCTTLKQIFNLSGDTFEDYSTHKLQFFYLERFGTNSNCWLEFNMEPIPTGNVTLEKQIENVNEAITDDQEYSFTITAIDANNETLDDISYVVYSTKNDTTSDPKYVDHSGTIKLKAFERAVFTNLPAGTKISFTEETGNNYEVNGWKLNSETCEAGKTVIVPEDGAINFVCTNTRYSADLSIAKELTGGPEGLEADYSFAVKIKDATYTGNVKIGEKTVAVGKDGVFELKAGQTAVIEDIPTGFSYTVTETLPEAPAGYKYEDPVYRIGEKTVEEATGKLIADTIVTVTNELTDLLGDLTITKSGIDNLDYHAEDANGNKAEYQSTIYVIEGTSAAGESIKMEVVIHGNGSVTIKDLPVGTYTVTEKTDWAWRYDLTSGNGISVTINGEAQTVSFTNTRSQGYWLGGDCFVENVFGAAAAAAQVAE